MTIVNPIPEQDLLRIEMMYKEDCFTLNLIGSGAFGRVYKYKSLDGKMYAVKISKNYNSDCKIKEAKDIETLLLLQGYDNIIKLYAYCQDSESFIIIMDYVDGVTFQDYEDSIYSERTSNIYFDNSFVEHFQGIVDVFIENNIRMEDIHRDNIMINKCGLPVIIDFGGFVQVEHTRQEHYSHAIDIVCDFYNYYAKEREFAV